MRVDQNKFLRILRAEIASSSQALYGSLDPYLEKAEAPSKVWTATDRDDADEMLAEFAKDMRKAWAYAAALFDPYTLSRGELKRYLRLVRVGKRVCFSENEELKYPPAMPKKWLAQLKKDTAATKQYLAKSELFASASIGLDAYLAEVPKFVVTATVKPGFFQCVEDGCVRLEVQNVDRYATLLASPLRERFRREGIAGTKEASIRVKQVYQVAWMRRFEMLRRAIRRALGALFFLTEEGLVKTFTLSKKDTALLLDPATREETETIWRRKARDYAAKHKKFVEVLYRDPSAEEDEYSLLYDAGPISTRIRVMEVSKEDTAVLFSRSVTERNELLDAMEAAAEEMALETGATIEVEIINPATGERKVIYEVSPDAALVLRREMTLEKRRQVRSWPFAANPGRPVDEMDVLLAMYADQQ